MENYEKQAILRILFAKIANELNVKYKIPKTILPHHFNVFFKNLRFTYFDINFNVFNNHWLYIDTIIHFQKTVRELINDYKSESFVSPLSYEHRLIDIEEGNTYVRIKIKNETITMGVYDENINPLGIFKKNIRDGHDGCYGVDGLFIQGQSLCIHKSLIDKINIFCSYSSSIRNEVSVLLSGETFKALTKSGH